MKTTAVALLLLLGYAAIANAQQPICKTYKKLLTSSSSKVLMDPIRVADSAPISSVVVNSMSVAFPKIGDLQVSLLRAPLGSATPDAAVILKKTGSGALGANLASTGFDDAAAAEFPAAAESAPFTGAFKPAQPLTAFAGKDASGSWVLRVADVPALASAADAATSPITLTGWSLTICFTQAPVPAIAASQGDDDGDSAAAAGSAAMGGNMTASGNMTMAGNMTASGNGTTGQNVSKFDGDGFNSVAMRLMFPWQLPEDEEPTVRASSGPLHAVKGAAWGAVHNEIKDFTTLLAAKSAATKTYLNKKLSDHINMVNGASALMQAAIKGQGGLLRSAGDSLMGHIGQLKAGIGKGGLREAAKAEMADKVDNLMKLGGHFMNLAGGVMGDMGSTATLMKDAATAKAKHVVDTYTTTEGVVKAHIDNSVQKRVDALNAMLDHIMKTADSASSVTGPVVDFKLQAHQAKLKALEAALDKLAALVKATPTPSQVVQGKMAFMSALAGMHPLGKAVTDPEAALAGLMGKVGQFKQMMTNPGQGHFMAMMTNNKSG